MALVGALPTSQWFLAGRLRYRPLVLPSYSPDRAKLLMQFAETRIIRGIPPAVSAPACVFLVGIGADAWVQPRGCLAGVVSHVALVAWPSGVAMWPAADRRMSDLQRGPAAAWVITYPPSQGGADSLASAIHDCPPSGDSFRYTSPMVTLAGDLPFITNSVRRLELRFEHFPLGPTAI